jgi:LL-H family phage holin
MEIFKEFINTYGVTILYTVLTAIAGYLGVTIKRLYKKWVNTKVKQDIARDCVKFVEQVYKNMHGQEKLDQAILAASEMLAEQGITVTELELRVLIESALAEFNKAFEK